MRLAILLTTAALAAAAPALAQTGTAPIDQTTPSTSPTPTPSPGATATPPATAGATTAPQVVNPAVGVTVYDPAGTAVGTIKSMDAQFVTLQTANGPVRLPVTGVGPGPKGALIGLSAADLNAQVAQAAAAQPAAAATSSTDAAADTKITTTTTTKHKTRRHR